MIEEILLGTTAVLVTHGGYRFCAHKKELNSLTRKAQLLERNEFQVWLTLGKKTDLLFHKDDILKEILVVHEARESIHLFDNIPQLSLDDREALTYRLAFLQTITGEEYVKQYKPVAQAVREANTFSLDNMRGMRTSIGQLQRLSNDVDEYNAGDVGIYVRFRNLMGGFKHGVEAKKLYALWEEQATAHTALELVAKRQCDALKADQHFLQTEKRFNEVEELRKVSHSILEQIPYLIEASLELLNAAKQGRKQRVQTLESMKRHLHMLNIREPEDRRSLFIETLKRTYVDAL